MRIFGRWNKNEVKAKDSSCINYSGSKIVSHLFLSSELIEEWLLDVVFEKLENVVKFFRVLTKNY